MNIQKNEPFRFSFPDIDWGLAAWWIVPLCIWLVAMFTIDGKPIHVDHGPFIEISAGPYREFKLSEPAEIEGGSKDLFELWNEKQTISKTAVAVSNKEMHPMGWDYENYYMVERFKATGDWVLKQGENVDVRIYGTRTLVVGESDPDVIFNRFAASFLILVVWLLAWHFFGSRSY